MMKLTALAIAGLLLASGAHAAGDAAAGQTKSAACAACHMADGNSVTPIWPKLAGQHAAYLAKQLSDFKAGNRTDPTMSAMAAPLSEQDVLDLAAYFSSQTMSGGAASPDLVKAGETLYRAGDAVRGVTACTACHGPTGSGNPDAGFPRLGGQQTDYVVKQLKAFRDGTRANDANAMMRDIAAKMTDQQIAAVASYVSGLH